MNSLSAAFYIAIACLCSASDQDASVENPVIQILQDELDYSMNHLVSDDAADPLKPYFLAFSITDQATWSLRASLGALYGEQDNGRRALDVDLRVGDYKLDNTRQLRGSGRGRGPSRPLTQSSLISTDNNEQAIRHTLWLTTDRAFKAAIENLKSVLTNQKTQVEEESQVDDFTREQPSVHIGEIARITIDQHLWANRIRQVSRLARNLPLIYDSSVSVSAVANNRYMVTSEGTRLVFGKTLLRVAVSASTKADDGMDLEQSFLFNASAADGLPGEEELREAFQRVIDQILALREAPIVEPYAGPAILQNRASGVFFHEIFGHRIEGHRQKDVDEGQTFAKMVGKPILPDFLSVNDDPTLARFEDEDLRGNFEFDEEGIPAARVPLVEDGVLKTFLMSRSPLENVSRSNGHGRREPGRSVVSRQGNLIVKSKNQVSSTKLRELLVEECRKQGKAFGFLFQDITGGFTTTSRGGPQAFKVLPVVVYRVFVDGRPDQLVRGVDIVGTPLACFAGILATGDDAGVFNGTCGAESGWVPVSAVSPSILVGQIEIEKRQQSQERAPILPAPAAQ
ncbi:MAG: metallopeptidase TldD-related protein [Verrucomicrobia bacterium]|nr:metallopeptidase TldD-related protein [Verrucomicrobiota bacterium]